MTEPDSEKSPFVGPRAFTEDDATIFFGRDLEAGEVVSRIIANAEVLLYAQSGAGKTSLINARLIPWLRKKRCHPLPARVHSPLRDRDPKSVKNVFVFNTLRSWEGPSADDGRLAETTLKDYLLGKAPDENDQFNCLVAIFDQFEALFTDYSEWWRQRGEFFEQVAEALNTPRLSLRAFFAMREEHIAKLDSFAPLLPDRLRTRFRLERLRRETAEIAVTEPLRDTGRSFAPEVAARLVENLLLANGRDARGRMVSIPGEFVEPLHLQIACLDLWEKVTRAGDREITLEHVGDLQGVDQALARYYDASLEFAVANSPVPVREKDLRDWFEETLITEAGTRGKVYRGETHTNVLPNEAVDLLVERLILRAEVWAGGTWLELTHDRFVGPIRDSNQRWLLEWSKVNARYERDQKDRFRQLRYISVIQSLAARAPVQSVKAQDELAALLARQAFLFSSRNDFRELDQVDEALREVLGVDWFHNILTGHTHRIWAVAYSPDGRMLASGGLDGKVRLWHLDRPGERPEVLPGGGKGVHTLAISPDGRHLASGAADGKVRLWRLGPGRREAELRSWDHGSVVLALGFDPGGRFLASGGMDRNVRLWRLDRPGIQPMMLDARLQEGPLPGLPTRRDAPGGLGPGSRAALGPGPAEQGAPRPRPPLAAGERPVLRRRQARRRDR